MKRLINDKEYEIATRAYLREADLRGADLGGADLREADLRGADLGGADLREADLRGADLRGADLREADLRGADLRGADLGGADLRGADLSGADLGGAYFRGADLRGADLRGAYLAGTKEAPERVIQALRGRAYRSDGYEFLIFQMVEDETPVIRAGCRTFDLNEFRAHVADQYPDTSKAEETLRILAFLEAQVEQDPW